MKWEFNEMLQVHELQDEGGTLAKIYLSEKPKNNRPFRARTLISGLYFGNQTMSRLDRARKEWVTKLKKFHSRAEIDAYVRTKKGEIERFIQAREKEVSEG
ncbi:MAG: hypothetical protein QF752_10600 [Planctomycetota bacterium]|jgi:hypothetical protein|nr:hypothetical protein [Planctomycetota bacterium]